MNSAMYRHFSKWEIPLGRGENKQKIESKKFEKKGKQAKGKTLYKKVLKTLSAFLDIVKLRS